MAPKGRFALKKDRKAEPEAPREAVLPTRQRRLDLPDAVCVHVENFFTIAECERYMQVLQNEIDWKKQQVAVGRRDGDPEAIVAEPRLTLFMSDPGICYEYSGRENVGEGWHAAILEIKEKAERGLVECGQQPVVFNSVQLNRYNGPRHALGMHADDEPDLQRGAPILSVSFGCTREFKIERRDQPSLTQSVDLADGSLLVMGGTMQQHYVHGVPPGGQTGLRFNLTFRVCIPRPPRKGAGEVQRISDSIRNGGYGGAGRGAEANPEIDRFIEEHKLDARAAEALRSSPPAAQRFVLDRGGLRDARNPSAAVLSRLRDARSAAVT
eukprot:TRINITY_DN27345_c0_g2_i1.p2 TRINITY_DN27345_c0_g2~~TRINITY_DN27345_c0_g2_i1.p2  ORF type:complete len:342 (+),score=75.12 TRINITY_DN27345_c0_g2_i1:54-1028(+)